MKINRLIPVTLITIVLLILLFRGVVFKLNSTCFSESGDGLKSYYCAWYHAEYDVSSTHFEGMNYPWGESIYFTDGQPPLANVVRFIDKNLFPCADKIPGVFNFMMIFSIFLSVIFLFLTLKKFKLPDWYASILAIGISFLSPQIGRLPGHFSLAWLFWIPLMMYLMILIIEKKSWLRSALFALVALLSSLMHMYFFLFAVALAGVYLFDQIVIHKTEKKWWVEILHFSLQIIVPFILLQLIMVDHQTDRTMHPWGFDVYKGYPGGVFLPVYKWYAPFIENFKFVKKYDWEALAYIGIIASAGFFFLSGKWMVGLLKQVKERWSFTGNRSLDVLFWAAFALLLFSFGIPFIWGFEKLQNSIGFLSQLRAVGRFSWLFYYVINVIVWIAIYRFSTSMKNKTIGFSILAFLLILLGFEAFDSSTKTVRRIDNAVPQLSDHNNQLEENKWVGVIDADKYQAIMPLPYFHIGSESSWIDPKCDMAKQMYIASLKTGLPCTGVMMGRTSLSQTYKNIELSRTPWENYRVLDEYPNNKPLLLMVGKCDELSTDEKRLVENASFVMMTPKFDLYEISIDTLKAIPAKCNFPNKYKQLIDSINGCYSGQKTDCFIQQTGNLAASEKDLKGTKVLRNFQRILEAPVNIDTTKTFFLRFWVKDYDKDMVARTQILTIQSTPEHQTLEENYSDLFRHIRSINGKWALIEIPLVPKQSDEIVKLLIRNSVLDGKELFFDDFLITTKVL